FARASRRALAESAFEEADAFATRALEGESTGAKGAEALLLRAEARRALGRTAEMLADATAARSLAEEHPALLIGALSRLGDALHVHGELAAADATLRGVLE